MSLYFAHNPSSSEGRRINRMTTRGSSHYGSHASRELARDQLNKDLPEQIPVPAIKPKMKTTGLVTPSALRERRQQQLKTKSKDNPYLQKQDEYVRGSGGYSSGERGLDAFQQDSLYKSEHSFMHQDQSGGQGPSFMEFNNPVLVNSQQQPAQHHYPDFLRNADVFLPQAMPEGGLRAHSKMETTKKGIFKGYRRTSSSIDASEERVNRVSNKINMSGSMMEDLYQQQTYLFKPHPPLRQSSQLLSKKSSLPATQMSTLEYATSYQQVPSNHSSWKAGQALHSDKKDIYIKKIVKKNNRSLHIGQAQKFIRPSINGSMLASSGAQIDSYASASNIRTSLGHDDEESLAKRQSLSVSKDGGIEHAHGFDYPIQGGPPRSKMQTIQVEGAIKDLFIPDQIILIPPPGSSIFDTNQTSKLTPTATAKNQGTLNGTHKAQQMTTLMDNRSSFNTFVPGTFSKKPTKYNFRGLSSSKSPQRESLPSINESIQSLQPIKLFERRGMMEEKMIQDRLRQERKSDLADQRKKLQMNIHRAASSSMSTHTPSGATTGMALKQGARPFKRSVISTLASKAGGAVFPHVENSTNLDDTQDVTLNPKTPIQIELGLPSSASLELVENSKEPVHMKQANSVAMPSSSLAQPKMFETIQVKKKQTQKSRDYYRKAAAACKGVKSTKPRSKPEAEPASRSSMNVQRKKQSDFMLDYNSNKMANQILISEAASSHLVPSTEQQEASKKHSRRYMAPQPDDTMSHSFALNPRGHDWNSQASMNEIQEDPSSTENNALQVQSVKSEIVSPSFQRPSIAYSGYSNPKKESLSSMLRAKLEQAEVYNNKREKSDSQLQTEHLESSKDHEVGEGSRKQEARSQMRNKMSHSNDPSVLDPSIINPVAESAAENSAVAEASRVSGRGSALRLAGENSVLNLPTVADANRPSRKLSALGRKATVTGASSKAGLTLAELREVTASPRSIEAQHEESFEPTKDHQPVDTYKSHMFIADRNVNAYDNQNARAAIVPRESELPAAKEFKKFRKEGNKASFPVVNAKVDSRARTHLRLRSTEDGHPTRQALDIEEKILQADIKISKSLHRRSIDSILHPKMRPTAKPKDGGVFWDTTTTTKRVKPMSRKIMHEQTHSYYTQGKIKGFRPESMKAMKSELVKVISRGGSPSNSRYKQRYNFERSHPQTKKSIEDPHVLRVHKRVMKEEEDQEHNPPSRFAQSLYLSQSKSYQMKDLEEKSDPIVLSRNMKHMNTLNRRQRVSEFHSQTALRPLGPNQLNDMKYFDHQVSVNDKECLQRKDPSQHGSQTSLLTFKKKTRIDEARDIAVEAARASAKKERAQAFEPM